jgi:hypothetical protein
MIMKKLPAFPRPKEPVASLKNPLHCARPSRQGKQLGQRAKLRTRQADGRFRFSDDQWAPIRDRCGFDDDARKRVELNITLYRNEREFEMPWVAPAGTRAGLAKLQSMASDLSNEISYRMDDVRAWDLMTDRFGWDRRDLYLFQNAVQEFASMIGQAKDRVERARPGARTHHNLNGFIHALILMWEEIHAAKFTRTKRRSGPNRTYNGIEFLIAVCKLAEPHFPESTFENAIRYVVEHKAQWEN